MASTAAGMVNVQRRLGTHPLGSDSFSISFSFLASFQMLPYYISSSKKKKIGNRSDGFTFSTTSRPSRFESRFLDNCTKQNDAVHMNGSLHCVCLFKRIFASFERRSPLQFYYNNSFPAVNYFRRKCLIEPFTSFSLL